ncbi:MAG: hypothetical protein J5809_06680 [Selenomonadaceae bacterium]|nr:hypothetical protein [Selenomonadaceae bacterium]
MKNFIAILFALAVLVPANLVCANPRCALMKFTDDTRYDSMNTAHELSRRVWNKISESGKFNLHGSEVLDVDIEARLYDEKVDELTKFDAAISSNDYNALFEGTGFDERKAQSIATAQVGQIVTPEITAEIGNVNGVEYLIQGTIVNLGTGAWLNEDLEVIANVVNNVAIAASSQAANLITGSMGFLNGLTAVNVKFIGIGVQCDIRLIKAATGEVVWSRRVLGIGEQMNVHVGPVTFGHSNLSSKLYAKALDKAANKIVGALVADLESNKLFLK